MFNLLGKAVFEVAMACTWGIGILGVAVAEEEFYFKGMDGAQLAPRSALVIGISTYGEATFPRLPNATKDVQLITTVLQGLGFDVFPKSDQTPLTRQTFKRVLYDYVLHVKQTGGTSLIYFAGHGLSYSGSDYLVPYDGMALYSRDIREELLPMDLLSDALAAMPDVYHIVILDACRDPGLGKLPTLGKSEIVEVTAGIRFKGPPDISFATSADVGQKAKDGNRNNSPYAEALAESMKLKNEPIAKTFGNVSKYFKRLNEGVSDDQKQDPIYLNKGGAEFYFSPTIQTFNEEKKVWDTIDSSTAGPDQYKTYIDSYPAGYYSEKARSGKNRSRSLASLQESFRQVMVAGDAVKFRQSASSSGQVLATFNRGVELDAFLPPPSEAAEWTLARRKNGMTGYIASKHLALRPTKKQSIRLDYQNEEDRPPKPLNTFLQSLKPENIVEIRLVAYGQENVAMATTRLIRIQAALREHRINPDIVKTSVIPSNGTAEANQIGVTAEMRVSLPK
ncbi:MAG: caspase family protein [Nitrospira sp.]|nr:MAG: caspase family protein [Nitrospira sp.]